MIRKYKGYDIFPHDFNSMGLKYYAYGNNGKLRADTLAGIKELINEDLKQCKV